MNTMKSVAFYAALLAVLSLAVAPATIDATPRHPRQTTGDAIQTVDGRTLFTTYCASCHGVDASGNGPAARSMRRMPPDLTRLAAANGGNFPLERVKRIVDGREVEAHGDRNMPVWGDAFKAMLGGLREDTVRARIAAIIDYLSSIQKRQA